MNYKTKEHVFTGVKRLACEQLGIDAKIITEDSVLVDNLGADSLDEVEFVMALEEEFAISITEEEAEKTHKINEYVDLIASKLNIVE